MKKITGLLMIGSFVGIGALLVFMFPVIWPSSSATQSADQAERNTATVTAPEPEFEKVLKPEPVEPATTVIFSGNLEAKEQLVFNKWNYGNAKVKVELSGNQNERGVFIPYNLWTFCTYDYTHTDYSKTGYPKVTETKTASKNAGFISGTAIISIDPLIGMGSASPCHKVVFDFSNNERITVKLTAIQ